MSLKKMKIHYPKCVEDIPPARQEELEKDLVHFLKFSPCERLRYVEKEWLACQDYIKRFGVTWNRKSN
jgi:hypothetical protein